jgi:hypothetical protein
LFQDNTLIQILEIEPIEYESLTKKEKQAIDTKYGDWLEQLSFPIQIISRKVNTELIEVSDLFKKSLEYEIKQKDLQKELLKLYESFEKWYDKHIKAGVEKNLYYIVVPFYSTQKLMDKPMFKKKNHSLKFSASKAILSSRVTELLQGLSKLNVSGRILEQAQIKELYASYYGLYYYNAERKTYETSSDLVSLWGAKKQ